MITAEETPGTTSLQRREAERRAELIDVVGTTIALDLTEPGDDFAATTTITFACADPGASTFLDFAGAELLELNLNGVALPTTGWTGRRVELPTLAAANTVVVRGRMRYSGDGEGLHRHVDPADGRTYLYAMSFLDAGPRWFACFDQPDLKSPYVLEVLAPADWVVAGNGPAERLADAAADDAVDGAARWRIVQPRPISSYVVTLVAGPYATRTTVHDEIPLALHAPASLADTLEQQAADIFATTAASFDYYHRVFGVRYPFGEYHQAFVPDFNAGAMENPGCVTLRSEYLHRSRATEAERATRAGIVAHELAHQWFGDLVTMRWWDDLWLNESFAEYLAHRAVEGTDYDLWTEFGIARKDWGYVADQAPSTHPVAGNGAVDAAAALADFDGISYAKGAALLRQLAGLIGDEVFFAGLRAYFAAHAYGNATLADLMSAWTAAGARGLDDWSAGWLQTAGLDTLTVEPTDGGVALVRLASPHHPVERAHAVTLVALDAAGAELGRSPAVVRERTDTWVPPVGTQVVVPDADDEAWAKIRFAAGWEPLRPLVAALDHPATRVVVANSVRDGLRDAELDPATGLHLLLELVASDPSDVMVSRLLAFVQDTIVDQLSPPAVRPQRRADVHAVARRLLEAAAPGSDRQLTVFRAAVRSADDVDVLAAWSAGECPGLHLDDDLRWLLVTRRSGLTGDADLIEQTLAVDPSTAGRLHAARARAGLPDAAAKEAAWPILVAPSGLGPHEIYAVADGFFGPDQTDLTAAYAERFFAEIGPTASFRTGWVLGEVAGRAFPSTHVDPTTLDRAEALVAAPDLAAPIRRSVVDRTDRLRRAWHSRRRFGS